MIFLIEFNRRELRLVSFKSYPNSARAQSSADRLALEIALLRRGVDHEVVTLEASSEEVIRKTHQRYFTSPQDLLRDTIELLDRKEAIIAGKQ